MVCGGVGDLCGRLVQQQAGYRSAVQLIGKDGNADPMAVLEVGLANSSSSRSISSGSSSSSSSSSSSC